MPNKTTATEDKSAMELCLKLLHADCGEDVISALRAAGYWDALEAWRPYGDNENNYSTVGNQQSRSDAALVEKVVNCVDAQLTNACLERGIDPESASAPETIQAAVALFFDPEVGGRSATAGRIAGWTNEKRTQVARGITLAATGFKPGEGKVCITVADQGEGQTPDRFPGTLVSLTEKSNKLRIPFVQGKFNMGGTGALRFCGEHNLELLISRRNPSVVARSTNPTDNQWGFTIVRRENPAAGARSSVYTYLAPLGADIHPRRGGILRFSSGVMPLFPEGRNAYGRNAEWGTLVKLYEYGASGYSNTHILLRSGLLSRLDILLPEIALPIRLHECRSGFRGHPGSFETTLTGVRVRLEDDKADNIEPGFPSSSPISAAGERMSATIYAFKAGRADSYRRNEGVILTVNGQTHGNLTRDFFTRRSVGLSYLQDSLLVVLDCSEISGRSREDLFMASRDRLSGTELRYEIESALEELLKNHDGLRALKERRRREEIESRLGDDRPLEEVLKSLLSRYPVLSSLFLTGQRVPNPFRITTVGQDVSREYRGKRHPTFFRFKGREYGTELRRECHINMRCRIAFETDVANDYFDRTPDRGVFELFREVDRGRVPVASYVGPNLQDGIGNLSIRLPANCAIGDELKLLAVVTDRSLLQPFENRFVVKVKSAAPVAAGSGTGRRGERSPQGKELTAPTGIAMPNITRVPEADWGKHSPPFDAHTALRIKNAGVQEQDGRDAPLPDVYDFFVNVDNKYLKTEIKAKPSTKEVLESRFKLGLVLLGLGMLQDDMADRQRHTDVNGNGEDGEGPQENVEKRVEKVSRAIAPVLLPMIEALGDLQIVEGSSPEAGSEGS